MYIKRDERLQICLEIGDETPTLINRQIEAFGQAADKPRPLAQTFFRHFVGVFFFIAYLHHTTMLVILREVLVIIKATALEQVVGS